MPQVNPVQIGREQTVQGLLAQGGTNAQGLTVAQRLLQSNMSVNALRTLGTLQKDEWIAFDNAVIEVARKRLVLVQELMSRGLTYNLDNPLGHTSLEWEKVSDMEGAIITMSGLSQSQNDRVVYDLDSMPIPIIHKDWNMNLRTLLASRNKGLGLDVTQAQYASRKVSETIESIFFDGATVLGSNRPIYGLRSAPYRNTGNLTESWMTASGKDIVKDYLAMQGALVEDNMYGPYILFIPTQVGVRFGEDYNEDSDKTIVSRLMELEGLAGIKVSKDLPINEVILVQLTSDVIEVVNGMSPTTVEWETHGGFMVNFKILAIQLPRIRNDFVNQSGIAHYASS